MNLHDFAGHLKGAKTKTFERGQGYIALCPAHDDGKNPSFAVWEGSDGFLHFKCQSGCTEDAILGAMGLKQEDRRTKLPPNNRETVYKYTDSNGRYLFEKVRIPKGKDKIIFHRVRERDGKPLSQIEDRGRKRWPTPAEAGLNGQSKVLYRLHEVAKAIQAGQTIYLNEGEKACDLMWTRGLAATCQPDGAGSGKWRELHTQLIKGAKMVVIVADRDDVGDAYAREVYEALTQAEIPCDVVRSKTLGKKDDAYDHFLIYGEDELEAAEDLMQSLSTDERLAVLGGIRLSTVEPKDVQWLWHPYIPLGRTTLMDGDGDLGKSYVACALAAAISNGRLPNNLPLPDDRRTILLLMSEDDAQDTIVPRILAFGGKRENIVHVKDLFPFDEAGIDRLRELCRLTRPILVVIDPVLAYCSAAVNINQANEIRPILDALKNVAADFNCGLINIRHEGKSNEGRARHHAGLGSVDIRNAHRSQIVVGWHKDVKGLRIIRHLKHNLSEEGTPFGYEFRDGEFRWNWNIPDESGEESHGKPKMQIAIDILRQMCTGQYVPHTRVLAEMEARGISPRTLDDAKKIAGVKYQRLAAKGGSNWYIQPPDGFDIYAEAE